MYFSRSHEWVVVRDNEATIGITLYARKELGDIVFVELPVVGAEVAKGEELVVLESTKAAVDVYSPVSGKITQVNDALRSDPAGMNRSPEREGWLVRIALKSPEELTDLSDEKTYRKFIDNEEKTL